MADDSQKIGDNEIEELLKQAQNSAASAPSKPSPPPTESAAASQTTSAGGSAAVVDDQAKPSTDATQNESSSAGDDIQFLLQQAEEAIASVDNPAEHDLETFEFMEFSAASPSHEKATLDLLRDVELDLRIELGRTDMYLEDV